MQIGDKQQSQNKLGEIPRYHAENTLETPVSAEQLLDGVTDQQPARFPMLPLTPPSETIHDASEVLQFLKSPCYVDLVYQPEMRDRPSNFGSHQAELISAGIEICDYIRLNRYTDDVYGDAVGDFVKEQSLAADDKSSDQSVKRLEQAVNRLKLLTGHLGN